MTTQTIRFYHQGSVREVTGVPASRTVLQYLREDVHCTGTKEGCAEGDCGACTVVIGELRRSGRRRRSRRSTPASSSCRRWTAKRSSPSKTCASRTARCIRCSKRMVDCHGSQCGFCTPGFVMSMWALYENQPEHSAHKPCPPRDEINAALSGNLCRCTGYRPIVDAVAEDVRLSAIPARAARSSRRCRRYAARRSNATTPSNTTRPIHAAPAFGAPAFRAPVTLDAFAKLRAEHPHARILAGSTDVGLWVTKQLRDLGDILYVGNVAELQDDRNATRGC